MRWARVAVGLGLVLLVAGFCVGVDTPISTTVAGQSYQCADVIGSGMLVSGQGRSDVTGSTAAPRRLEAQVAAACRPLERDARWLVRAGFALGALVLLTGWTVLREERLEYERHVAVPA